ncbi:MAG: nucleoside hydrolase [Kiritimatiellae bacterium]|nr:nucleoside hydrolase [Kiritimatiellia bacterium]
MRRFALAAAALSSLAAFAEPTRVIFDTDMCGDYDDVGALAVLNALADAGECEILGVVSSTRRTPALALSGAICGHYGRPYVPMGACREIGVVADDDPGSVSGVLWSIARAHGPRHLQDSDEADDANEVYRCLLAAAPDHSVTLCVVGFATNVRRLLETKGDCISPLSGRDLVARKVKAWYQMGGVLPGGLECNLRMDAESSDKAIRECPVPIYFVDFGLGVDVLTGLSVARRGIAAGPVAEAFARCLKVWDEERCGRPSWDELTVLAAVRGWERDFGLERGTMSVDPATGSNTWTKAENGPHGVLVEKTPKAALRDVIDELMARPPACRSEGSNSKPFVWWHWCGTAVTKEGIVRDLDAMKAAGIGGATIFQVARGPCSEVPAFGYEDDTMKDFEFGGDKWWEYVAFAASEAKRRGLEIGMHNCPGYTVSGGPWITPENAMKKLVWTSAPKGSAPAQPEMLLGFYRDIGTVESGGKVYRFGYTCTGSQCMPVAKSLVGRCLEADKMSARAVNLHLDNVLARDVGLDFILMDSYEAGPYDWTDDFRAEFEKRRGYDPLPLLPAYVGAVSEGAEKIKADMARTVAELSTERHYWVFRDRIHEKGMRFFVEPYGGPFDQCEAAYASDQPTTEFWGAKPFWVQEGAVGGSPQLGGAVGRAAGRTVIAAEAYTAMPFQDPYVLAPRDFKACTDASFARGINRMVLHHWVHQPFPACRRPGMNMGYWGAHFGENQTWFEPGKEFFAYLSRCQERLQRGEEMIDVLAVEEFGGRTDGVDILPRRVFKGDGVCFSDGRCVVRLVDAADDACEGQPSRRTRSYRYLAVPRGLMSDPEIAAKVAAAKAAGVEVLDETSPMPKRPFSVVGGVEAGPNGPVLGVARKCFRPGSQPFFFVANVSGGAVSFDADFRAQGQVDLWYPGSGETEILAPVEPDGEYTRLHMSLGPQESVFVTFHCQGRSFGSPPMRESRRAEASRVKPVACPWTVSFASPCGAAAPEREWPSLASWSESGERDVRYFSGTAVYRAKFALTREEARAARRICLGDVRDIARVRLNGRDLGVAWHEPFEVAACDAAREGENVLEVEVTNGWHNRLLGDHLLPDDDCEWGPERFHQCAMDGSKGACGRGLRRIPDWAWNADGARPASNRVAFTSWDYFVGGEKPRPSGLLGPVTVKLLEAVK